MTFSRAGVSGLLCACLLFLPAAPYAQSGPAAAQGVNFKYDIALEAPAGLRKLLEENLDLFLWRGNERMSPAQLALLLRQAPGRIGELLSTEGYFSPRIDVKSAEQDGKQRVRLTVDPGVRTRVNAVDLQIVGPFNDGSADHGAHLEKIRADWSLPVGAEFRQADWEAAKRGALRDLLLDRYPAAALKHSSATVDPASASVALQVVFDSGPAFHFGALEIRGLRRYPARLVERLNPIRAGDPYTQARLLELQSQLQGSPYFADAEVSADKDTANASSMPVQVEVVENPARRLGFGIGMSTDAGARGQMDYRDLDFLGRAWRLGGALKLEQERQSLGGDLQFPISAQGYSDSIHIQAEHADIEGERIDKLSAGGKRMFVRANVKTTYGLRYSTETQRARGVAGTRSATLSPHYAWALEEVDQLLYPRRGLLANLQIDAASHALLSDRSFVRGHGRIAYFHPLGERDHLILRGELGMVAAGGREGIASDYLFRTGGDQTVRGYAYQSLGLRQGGAVVGGRYLALASAEYVHWLTARWGGALFIDGGNAADRLHDLSPVYGVGVGARWKSPVGPLGLDLAYGEKTGKLRLHFSVGFSF